MNQNETLDLKIGLQEDLTFVKAHTKGLSKKAISLLLSIMMIVGMCSASFVSFAGSPNPDVFNPIIDKLAIAMQTQVMKDYKNKDMTIGTGTISTGESGKDANTLTKTLVTNTYQDFLDMNTILDLIKQAIVNSPTYLTHPDTSSETEFSNLDIAQDEIIAQLNNSSEITAAQMSEYGVEAFIAFAVDDLSDLDEKTTSWVEDSSADDKDANNIWLIIDVSTLDWRGYINANSSKDAADYTKMYLTSTYKVGLSRNEHDVGCDTYRGYCFHKNTTDPSFAVNTTITTTASNAQTAIKAYIDVLEPAYDLYYNFEKVYDLYTSNTTLFNTTKTNITNALSTFKSYCGDGDSDTADEIALMTAVSSDYSGFLAMEVNFEAAANSAAHLATAQAWQTFASENAAYGVYDALGFDDGVDLQADFTEFKTNIYDKLNNASSELVDYFASHDYIDMDYYTNFKDNADAYYAQEVKVEADALVESYADVDVSTLTPEEQSAAAGILEGYIKNAESYSDRVEGSIYDSDLTPYYGLLAEFEYASNDSVAFFAENTTKSFDSVETADILDVIANTDSNLASLNSFYNQVATNAGADKAESLLGDIKTEATALEAELYTFVGDRFEVQVGEAYSMYQSLGNVTAASFDMETYYTAKSKIQAIETVIYDSYRILQEDGETYDETLYTTYVSSEARTQYAALLKDFLPVYEEYRSTCGFSTYEQNDAYFADGDETGTQDHDYGSRPAYENDILKTEDYSVTEEGLDTFTDLLEDLVASDVFTDALLDGQSVEDFVMGMLEDLVFTDSFVNTIVGMLYPLVQGEFNKVWSTLPLSIEYLGLDVYVKYQKTLENILEVGDMALMPRGVAAYLKTADSVKYADLISDLLVADTNWSAQEICNESGSLALNWGVDEAMAAIDLAIENGTYNENTDASKLEVFSEIAGDALQCLNPLIQAILCGNEWSTSTDEMATGTITVGIKVDIAVDLLLGATANDGYVNTLGPIFDLLGYSDYKTASQISSQIKDAESLVNMLIGDLFSAVEGFLAQPIHNVINMIPTLAYVMAFDMIPSLLSMLKTDIEYDATVDTLDIGSVMADKVSIDIGEMLDLKTMGIDTSKGINGILDLLGIQLPNLNEYEIGTLGALTTVDTNRTEYIYTGTQSGKAYQIDANESDVIFYVVDYVLGLIATGEFYDLLGAFMDDTSSVENIISALNISNSSTAEVVAAVIELLNPTVYEEAGYIVLPERTIPTYTDPETGETVELPYGYELDENGQPVISDSSVYTEYWTQEKAEYVTGVGSDTEDFVVEILGLLGIDIEAEINDLLASLYTQENIQAILDLVAPYIAMISEDDTISAIIDIVAPMIDGVDVVSMIDALASYEVTEFEAGDRDAFVKNLVALVEPVVPILKLFLFSDTEALSLVVKENSDSRIDLVGYNGYESAIVPLLEAIGCDSSKMTNYEDLQAMSDEEIVYAILNPITALLDTVAADPIMAILNLVPNIIYFIEQNGLNTAIENLLKPVYAVLDTIRPIYDITLAFDFSIISIVDDLLNGLSSEAFTLPSFSTLVNEITAIGATESRTSVLGEQYNYLVIDEERYPALLSAMLYTVVDGLTIVENIKPYVNIVAALTDFLPDNETTAELKELLTTFAELDSPDQVLFVLYYAVYGVDVGVGTFEDSRDLVAGEIEKAFEVIGGFESDPYADIAGATSGLLDDLAGQLGDLGIPPESIEPTLNFFQKIIKAFQDFFTMIGDWFKV